MLRSMLLVAVAAMGAMGAGCADDQSAAGRQRQDAALKDPWNYSPYQDNDYSVSGGGMTDFNSKAFKRDVNSMFGP